MRLKVVLPFLFVVSAFAQTLPPGVQKKASIGGITEYDFPNGLRVLLFPDSSSPKVTVNMTYLVGSRHEGYGETGMAHLLEHMNFILTTNGRNIKKELTDHGAQWNGTTDYDRTNYFETVTATDENLKWALGLEADRMVNMRMEKPLLDTEMTVVRNEFERGENNPQSILQERVVATAYLWHNYGKSVIGSRADIEKVPIERLAAFYRKFYQPDNAVLVIAGQFDESKALGFVTETCGKIPRPTRKLDETYTVEPVQDGERFVELRRVGNSQAVMVAWHAPALAHPDSAALEVLSGIMAGGGGRGGAGTGRLYKALVDNRKAVSVRMGYEELHDPGFVLVAANLSKDQSLEDARKTILDTIAGVVSEPPTADEVKKEKSRILQGMEQRLRNSQQAALGLSETIASGDWRLFFLNYDQIKAVTPDDVVRVAKLYFKSSNRTVGEFIATPDPDRTEVPIAPDIENALRDYKSTLTISQGESFDPSPENIEKRLLRSQLKSGLRVVMLPKTTRGATVSATIDLQFGDEKSLAGRRATADLTAALLMRGTKNLTRQQIQDEMVKLDARIAINGGPGRASATIQTTSANLIPTLRLTAELLREPVFPEAELDQVKKQRIAAMESSKTEPGMLAPLALERSLRSYPKNDVRYIATLDEQIEDLAKVTVDQVRRFHSQFYSASHGQFVIAGQFDAAATRKIIEDVFGNWTSSAPYQRVLNNYQKVAPVNLKIETPDKQNATFDAAIALAMRDSDPDYPAMVLANYMFGGSITGRAPNRIRNLEGLSYGVNSRFSAPAEGDLAVFGGTAISNPKNAPRVEASFTDELAKTVANGFTPDEVAAAKKAIHDQQIVARSQDATLMRLLATREEFGRTMKWDQDLETKIETLTADQVNSAFRRHINPASLSIVKAGDFTTAGVYK
jgi:zinc protease